MKPICLALFDGEQLRLSLLAAFLQSTGCYRVVAQHSLCAVAAGAVDSAVLDGAILVVDKLSPTEHAIGETLRHIMGPRPIVVCTVSDAAWTSLMCHMESDAAAMKWRPDLCVGATCTSIHLLRCVNKLFLPISTADADPPRSVSRKQALALLSPQEKTVFQLIGAGQPYKKIGEELNISQKTVETYVRRMCGKLNLSGSRALQRLADGKRSHER